jgi:hypothetical protein
MTFDWFRDLLKTQKELDENRKAYEKGYKIGYYHQYGDMLDYDFNYISSRNYYAKGIAAGLEASKNE